MHATDLDTGIAYCGIQASDTCTIQYKRTGYVL